MFVYDMTQDAVLKHLHYHRCVESMAHRSTIKAEDKYLKCI